MHKTLKMTLSTASINQAIQELEQLKSWIEAKTKALNERLAMLGTNEAAQRFGGAIYDGRNDVSLTAEQTEKGWRIIAEGQAVFFIEFGAGVHHNTSEPYPEPRPNGIVGIGEYGKEHGKNEFWYFKGADGTVYRTYGNPAAMPMFYASEAIQNSLREIAQEVFG